MIPRKYSLLGRNIIWAGVIFFLCAIPSDSIPDPKLNIPHLDKVVHFGMFFIMSIFLCSELRYQTQLSLRKIYMITISFSFIYGDLSKSCNSNTSTGVEIGGTCLPMSSGAWSAVCYTPRRKNRKTNLLITYTRN